MINVDLIYFNAGGGHRAAALALQAVCHAQHRPWNIRLVNLMEVLDPEGAFRRVTGMAPEDWYNRRLAKGWTLGLAQELKVLQGLIRLGHASMHARLSKHWRRTAPAMVVSLIPNFNRVLCESLNDALPGVPYITVMTDMADYPPNFWREPDVAQHLVCGTDRAMAQALVAGHAKHLLHRVSGMIVHPRFYVPLVEERAQHRARFGLNADTPTGVVMFGGAGSKTMEAIARALPDTPLVLMCGHNAKLAANLRGQPSSAPRVVVEFTPDVRSYMALGDFFIGKPGPGSLTEAVLMGLPVVTVRNAFTMPQERYNTDWARENGLGLVLRGWNNVGSVPSILESELPALRTRVAAYRNRAVFEVPEILDRILCGQHDLALAA